MPSDLNHPQIDHTPLPRVGDNDHWIGAKKFAWSGLAGGCLMSCGSAVVTCCLLVVDGALVMGILAAMAAAGVEWVKNENAIQFVLFAGPICLTIIQWFVLDTVRGRHRRQRRRKDDAVHPLS